jgi:hypothetical protein
LVVNETGRWVINKLYRLLTLLVIVISGNPAVSLFGKESVYVGALLIFLALWSFKPLKLSRQNILVMILFGSLTAIHGFSFGSVVAMASLGFLIKVGIALMAVRLIPAFSLQYVSVMCILAGVSLIFYVPVQLGLDLPMILASISIPLENADVVHIGIHNFHTPEERGRNCGMFWEPGAFAGYLVLALFVLVRDLRNSSVISKQSLLLVVTLLTTQSTTGYVAFSMLVALYVYSAMRSKSLIAKIVILPAISGILGFGVYAAINELPFLGEKIALQMESAKNLDDQSRINRFGNLLYDVKWIAERPVVGWSATPQTRSALSSEVTDLIAAQGNGLSGFAVKFGLVGLFLFLGFFAYAVWRVTGSLAVTGIGVVVICLLLNGEQFLNFPIFLTLMFVPYFSVRRPREAERLASTPRTTASSHGM